MFKTLKIILTVLVTSFYFFPFTFSFLPVTNTKNLLAALGLVFVVFEMIRRRDISAPNELLVLLLISSMVSITSIISITYNETPDTTYVSYIRSAIIWLSGAFSVCYIIRGVHGRIDVSLVVHYLIGVCLFQCVSAMLITFIPTVQAFVDSYVMQSQDFLKDVNRIYGIGASLDVAGIRFSAVLVAIAILLVSSPQRVSIGMSTFYTLSFVVITIIGNMIARTTIIGTGIGLAWILVSPFIYPTKKEKESPVGKGVAILGTLASLIAVSVFLYNTFPDVKELLRFGFEGFFSLFETGEWHTDSTDKLESMIVWPEELRTWIIGDGYFENSRNDPNYLGSTTDDGFYMGTDIGYLRFIYYFGIAGLIWMIAVVAYSAYVCANYFKDFSWLFALALFVGLIVWLKVSSDIFFFFCLFLCAAALQEKQAVESEPTPEISEAP